MIEKISARSLFIFCILLFVFLLFLDLNQIYHQDEHRWAMIADGSDPSPGPHPPLFRTLLTMVGGIFGFENLRSLPFLFSILNLILIYFVSKKISGNKTVGLIASFLFAVNTYSLIAGLQIDIDGAILPFFVLAGYYVYYHLKKNENPVFWVIFFFVVIAGGFLSKLSFLLFIGALILDFAVDFYKEKRFKAAVFLKYIPIIILPLVVTAGLFYYFSADQFSIIAEYAAHFKRFNFAERAYFELGFKVMKSLVWLSPLLLLPALYGLFNKEIFRKYKFWYLYLFLNLVFYLIIFDFAKLTIERYFMFMIVPAVLISGEVIFRLYNKFSFSGFKSEWLGAMGIFLIFTAAVLWVDPIVLPLNPKNAYVSQIKSLDFNFLIPFSGGSGPIGFYFSAKFILWSWVLSALFLAGVIWKNKLGFLFLASFIVFGLGYNWFFVNEFLNGSLYGSPAKIARTTVDHVLKEPSIEKVITYNDIAPYDLKRGGKYEARFYTAPSRDYTERMEAYRGHYMVVDFPEIGRENRYWKLLERCPMVKEFQDKKIHSYIFDCHNLLNI